MNAFKLLLVVCLTIGLSSTAIAQSDKPDTSIVHSADGKTVTMAAGSQFAASSWKQLWWGQHWRQEWMLPVSFPVFDMDTVAGGLTPLKRGGGHETKTLRVAGANGREYVLRTVDKSLDVLIPDEFKGSFINDLVNDQISTAHPYGPLVTAQLSNNIGIMHTNPVIVFVPVSARLGEFNKDFGNKLCLFEERPSGDGWGHTPLTWYADDIVNSEKLFDKLQKNNSYQVDQPLLLKVRLFDMLINDWDRHEDQWVWAGTKKNGKTLYRAFARDRDQSFSKTDGVNMWLLSRPWALRSVQNMNARVGDVIGTNLSAKFIDKQLLNSLTKEQWEQTIESLRNELTDSAIAQSVRIMPANIYDISGDFIIHRLQQRRDDMARFGMKYYKILSKDAVVVGSDEPEIFTINRPDRRTTEITVQSVNKKEEAKDTVYHRVFYRSQTKHINVYGLGGDDQFIYTGKTKNKILVRSFGNDDKDTYTNNTGSKQTLKKAPVYDMPADKPAAAHLRYKATTDTSVTNYDRKSTKYDWWIPLILPGYNPDDGFILGGGLIYRRQQWNKDPYGWQQTFGGNYAFNTGAYSFFYKGIFKQTFGKWDLTMAADYKAPAFVVNYYGFGNDTKLLTKDKNFYRTRATSTLLNPGIGRTWKKRHTFNAGLLYTSVKVETADNKFISLPGNVDPSVYNTKYFGGVNTSYEFNTTNNPKYPTKGIRYELSGFYLRNLKDHTRDYFNLQTGFTFYYTPIKNITIAHRTGAAMNFDDYEFYQANTLGGLENLRGYWRTRFAGRTSFYQNTDLRIQLANLRGYVLRGKLGIYGFFDDGRVWVKNDDSNTLHLGYGGGVYFIPYSALAVNLSYATSKEVNVFTFRAGFLF